MDWKGWADALPVPENDPKEGTPIPIPIGAPLPCPTPVPAPAPEAKGDVIPMYPPPPSLPTPFPDPAPTLPPTLVPILPMPDIDKGGDSCVDLAPAPTLLRGSGVCAVCGEGVTEGGREEWKPSMFREGERKEEGEGGGM